MTTREAWEREARDWIKWSRTPGHDAWYLLLNLPRFLEMLPPPPRLIVDIGCGEGRLAKELSGRGYDVVGLDSSSTLISAAGQDPSPVVQADSARLPLRSAITDTVIFFMSLQDMDDPDAAITEAGRILRPRGQVHIAIVHPMNTAGTFTAEAPDADFMIARSYFSERIVDESIERDGIQMRFIQHHRPLERYFHALEQAGLLVRNLRELKANERLIERAAKSARWTKIPIFLHLTAIKDG
ncbi:MAG: class I SAM-dependent methyltransferase [Actinomycetota bacterium]